MGNETLAGAIGFNFGIKDYTTLFIISFLFILFIILFFVFVLMAKKREDAMRVVFVKDFSRANLIKKKKEGKYFWDD